MRKRFVVSIAAAIGLGACATDKPIPDGYTGPLAEIQDSYAPRSSTSYDIFYVKEVNHRSIPNGRTATRDANYGRGFHMDPVFMKRSVPAQPSTFNIYGRTEHAAPILALVNKVYEVSGETTFTPLANHTYVVTGELRDDHSAVWIVDAATHEVVGQKIEVKGSSTLGFFEK